MVWSFPAFASASASSRRSAGASEPREASQRGASVVAAAGAAAASSSSSATVLATAAAAAAATTAPSAAGRLADDAKVSATFQSPHDLLEESDDDDLDRKPKARDTTKRQDGKGGDKMIGSASSSQQEVERRMLLDSMRNVEGANLGFSASVKMWTDLPERLQIDKDFVLAALRYLPFLPDKNLFERKLPQSLRFDRDVALALCEREDFPYLYEQRHLYPPHCLTGDKAVMLAYCRKIPRALQECSEELADDREVVEAAIALDGLELQYASRRLQEDPAVVRAACQRDGRALEFVPPGPLKASLCGDRDFMMEAVRQKGGSVWRLASDALKEDRQLLLEALANGMRLRFCPAPFQEDTGFLCDALERKSLLYLELPRAIQSDQAVAMAAVTSPTSTAEVHARALELVPRLAGSRDVVLAVAQRGNADIVADMFLAEGNAMYRDDKEVVLAVLAKRASLFSRVSQRLRADNDVLVAAMDETSALDIIKLISPTVQEENPEIPAHAIKVCSERNLRYIRGHIRPASLWGTKIVAMEWVKRGQPCLPAFDPFMGDPDFALAIAQHVPADFSRVDASLRGREAFMREAVALDGRVLRHAEPALQSNYSLLVRAIATTPDALWTGAPVTRQQVIDHLNEKLQLHRVFVGDFLRGIAIHSSAGGHRVAPSKRSALPLLDRGVETSQAFKRLIAEFLGVPLGRELERVRQAHANLINPPPRPPAAAPLHRDVWDDPMDDFDDPWIPMMRGAARRADRMRRMFGGVADRLDDDEDRFMMMMQDDAADELFAPRRLPAGMGRAGAAVPRADAAPANGPGPAAAAAAAPANVPAAAGAAAGLANMAAAPPRGAAARFAERERRRALHPFAIRMEFRRPDRAAELERRVRRIGFVVRGDPRPADRPGGDNRQVAPAADPPQAERPGLFARAPLVPPAAVRAEVRRPAPGQAGVDAMDRDENHRMIARMLLQDEDREEEFFAALMERELGMEDADDFFDPF